MKDETVIKMWKQGYTKKRIVEEHLEDYTREIYRSCGNKNKPSIKTLKDQVQQRVEEILLKWWKQEVNDNRGDTNEK